MHICLGDNSTAQRAALVLLRGLCKGGASQKCAHHEDETRAARKTSSSNATRCGSYRAEQTLRSSYPELQQFYQHLTGVPFSAMMF